MSFTAYMLDVVSDTIYPARITIEDGLFKEVTPPQLQFLKKTLLKLM